MNTKQTIQLLKSLKDRITSDMIKDLISEHQPVRTKTIELYKKYTQDDVEILDRQFEDPNKINNKIPNDFYGDIIDGITGYMFGEPIGYYVSSEKYKESEHKKITSAISEFNSRNSIDDLDSTTGEMMSICGRAFRLLYIDIDGKERIMNVNPWECFVIKDATLDEVQYGMIYYETKNQKNETRIRVEWYDKKYVSYFIQNEGGDYVPDNSFGREKQKHMFSFVPLIQFSNNNILKGDFEKVDAQISAYDRLTSDIQNEIEEFRIAYFAFYGEEPEDSVIKKARQTGAFYFPEGADGKFLVKPLDVAQEFIKEHKDTLTENIYKFSKSVDMRDEKFSGANMSGESRKWKLVSLENRAKTKERKFVKALRYQYKVLCSAWNKKQIMLKPEDIEFKFKRNLPIDLKYHAEATSKLRGNISEETRLSLLPFVQDTQQEIEKMKADADPVELGGNYENI